MGFKYNKPFQFLAIVLFSQLIMDITVFLDIPIARQVIGFVYFTCIPGFVIVKLLKIKKLSFLEQMVLSVGLSLASVMLIGLFINILLPIFNISTPLSVLPLTLTFNAFVILGAIIAFLRGAEVNLTLSLSRKQIIFSLLLLSIPILSVIGAIYSNVYGNTFLLSIMILFTASIFAVFALVKKRSFSNLYAVIIVIIAISLLLQFSLVSGYVHGNDTSLEYFLMSSTHANSIWSPVGTYPNDQNWGRINSMLSLTILPAIYESVPNISATWMYMIIFPLIFALVPLGLFLVWRKYIDIRYAFIAAFVFMAEPTFYTEMLGLARQMIGELFFVLLLFVILKKEIRKIDRLLFFSLFSFGLIVSHYALAEIFLGFMALTYLGINIFRYVSKISNNKFFEKKIGINLSLGMVLLFFAIMFSWYLFTSGSSVFNSFLSFGQNVINQIGDFANPASRGPEVMLGLGLTSAPTIWNSISRFIAYIIETFIVIGFLGLILKRVENKYDGTYTLFTSLAIVLLATLILVPGLASTMNMTRFYHILLFFLAPLCVLGVMFTSKLVYKHKKEIFSMILLVAVLLAYFFFQTGFVYELTGSVSYSLPFNVSRFGPLDITNWGIVYQQDAVSAQWLSRFDVGDYSQIYSGETYPLIDYGAINYYRIQGLTNVTQPSIGDFAYLATLNTRYYVVVSGNSIWNTSVIANSVFPSADSIYSSNQSQIYTFTYPQAG